MQKILGQKCICLSIGGPRDVCFALSDLEDTLEGRPPQKVNPAVESCSI